MGMVVIPSLVGIRGIWVLPSLWRSIISNIHKAWGRRCEDECDILQTCAQVREGGGGVVCGGVTGLGDYYNEPQDLTTFT